MIFAVLLAVDGGIPARALDYDRTATLYVGQLTDAQAWHDLVRHPNKVGLVDSYLLAGAVAWTLARFWDDALSLEVEGQVVRHFGVQDHWEFNLPAGARWHRFPWNDRVETTVAFAVGPSYATRRPSFEVELEGESTRLLFHWFIELTVGPPRAEWAVALRLHHRSSGFGSLADAGGVDALAMGIKFRF
jgi:hypothetical protein